MSPFPRQFVATSAVIFAGIGVVYLLFPDPPLALVGLEVEVPSARVDLRATYGGLNLGVGAFLAWAASKPERVRAGIAACGLCLCGYLGGRVFGMLADGLDAVHVGFGAVELACAAVALLAWRVSAASAPPSQRPRR